MTAYNITASRRAFSTVGYQAMTRFAVRFARGVFALTGQGAYPVAPGERQQFGIVT